MTRTTTPAGTSPESISGERRRRGIALIMGAALIGILIEGHLLSFSWLPALIGLTYLAAAALSRSRGTLWSPGLIVLTAGLAAAVWLRSGRPADSFKFLALTVMALGLGSVLAAGLAQLRGWVITPMSVALSVLLFGVFLLLEQQAVKPLAGHAWLYVVLLALWGVFELRPVRHS